MGKDEIDDKLEIIKLLSMETAVSRTLSSVIPESGKIPLKDLDITRLVVIVRALDTYCLTNDSQFSQFRKMSGDALLNLKGQYLKSLDDGRDDLPTDKKELMSEESYDEQLEQLTGIVNTIRRIDIELMIRTLYGYAGEPIRRGVD